MAKFTTKHKHKSVMVTSSKDLKRGELKEKIVFFNDAGVLETTCEDTIKACQNAKGVEQVLTAAEKKALKEAEQAEDKTEGK